MTNSYLENLTVEEKINAIKDWANTKAPSDFNCDFVYSLEEQYWNRRELTPNQESALDRIIIRWGIFEQ